MATIVTRTAKGSELTFAEVDGNFTNLNADGIANTSSISNLQSDKLDKSGGTMSGALVLNSNLTTNAKIITNSAANSQSGSLVTLTTPGTEIVRLTNVLLTSLAGCQAGTAGQKLILSNRTGTSVTVLNDSASASTSADQISTGSGSDIILQNNASISLIYDGSLSKWNIIGGTGSGAGSSGINYILNPDASIGTTGYVAYNDGTAAPVDGSGGTPASGLWVRSTTTPLRGSGDFNLVKTGSVSYLGNGVAYDFTIDNADLAKVLTVTFDYEVVSGTYATGDATVYVIQDPAGTPVVIQPAGYQIQSATVGTKMKQIATFQTASNVTSYRLCIHVASASTSDYVLALDSISVGPQVVQYGAPVTDWLPFTPTGSWTANTTYTGRYRRVGDKMDVEWQLALSGAPNAAVLTLNLPAGFSIDTTKILNTTAGEQPLGRGSALDTSVSYYPNLLLRYSSTTSLDVQVDFHGAAGTQQYTVATGVTQAVPFTFGNTDKLWAAAQVPILGWSSTVQMSNDTDTRVVAATLKTASSTTLTANTAISFSTVRFDTHGSWSTNTYTVPVSGYYRITGTGWYTTVGTINMAVFVDGLERERLCDIGPSQIVAGATTISVNAGQLITIRPLASGTLGLASIVTISIERLSGPSAIAASETVAARYEATGNRTPTNAKAVNYDTKVFDTHGAVTTVVGDIAGWKFTVPIAGKYSVSVSTFSSAAVTSTLFVAKNGTNSGWLATNNIANVGQFGTGIIDAIAGDTVDIRADGTPTLNNVAAKILSFSIHRIGN